MFCIYKTLDPETHELGDELVHRTVLILSAHLDERQQALHADGELVLAVESCLPQEL